MTMITLPHPPRRAWLMSFWLTISVLLGLMLVGVLSLISPRWSVLGLMLTLGLLVPGVVWPQAVGKPYRAWNRLARTFGRGARLLLTGICFCVIVVAGRTGSSLRLSRPHSLETLWLPRKTLGSTTYLHQHDAPTRESGGKSWIRNYIWWARQSGNLWTISLLPFLILLRTVEPEVRSTYPANIYTLF